MRSDSRWVLVDTLQPVAAVVLVGSASKKRAPLESFLRANPDRYAIIAAISAARSSSAKQVRSVQRGQAIVADPIVGPNRLVHGVWFRLSRPHEAIGNRPLAWPLTWDLDQRVAYKPQTLQTCPSPQPEFWSIAEALELFELDDLTVPALAMIVDPSRAKPATYSYAKITPPSGTPHTVHFSAAISTLGGTNMLHGLTYDAGPLLDNGLRPRRIGDIVARAVSHQQTYRAVVDLKRLDVVAWYGRSPDQIAWRLRERTPGVSCLHPDDRAKARRLADDLRNTGTQRLAGPTELRLRLTDGRYAEYSTSAALISLDSGIVAALVSISPR